MPTPNDRRPKPDDGLVSHTAAETPDEVAAFWTRERQEGARSAMPELTADPPPRHRTPRRNPQSDN